MDTPIFIPSHTAGFKGVLGGGHDFDLAETSIWKRLWLSPWGEVDVTLKGGIQWNIVPFPLLILLAANLSYITQKEMFDLIDNMESLSGRYTPLTLIYDMNDKLLNYIPSIKKLKWREAFRFRTLHGNLTDKNNPSRSNNPELSDFPQRGGSYTNYAADLRVPYLEASMGIHNIFRLLHIEYVRRLAYLNHPGINK